MPSENIYLNTAACGLVPPELVTAANDLYRQLGILGSTRAESWRMNEEAAIRDSVADFLNAQPDSIALIPNFSWAINGIVQSLNGTERVLLYRNDYPSFIEPFRINGFDIVWTEPVDDYAINIDEVAELITTRKVDIVALSHVQWRSGYKLDIKAIGELCKANDVLFIVDATQSMGAHEIDLTDIHTDVFAASNYKWMNAGFGTGVLSVKESFLQQYTPVVGGYNSYKIIGDKWMYTPSAQSYEPGHPNMFGFTVLNAAIAQKTRIGIAAIEDHNMKLAQLLLDELEQLPVSILGDYSVTGRAAIVMLKDQNGLGERIKRHNITVTHRNGLLRASMHYYNTEADVISLVDCIKAK